MFAERSTLCEEFKISSSSDSSSSEDESATRYKKAKCEDYVEKVVPRYCDDTFKSHFRLTRSSAEIIRGTFVEFYYF